MNHGRVLLLAWAYAILATGAARAQTGGGTHYTPPDQTLAAECTADGEFLVCSGAGTIAVEDAATARASMDAQQQSDQLDDVSAAGVASSADLYLYSDGVGSYTYGTITSAGRALVDDATASDQRATMGAQAQSGALDDLSTAGTVGIADQYLYSDGASSYTFGTITSAGRALVDDATASDQRATMGAQAQSDQLDDVSAAGVASSADLYLYSDGVGSYTYGTITSAGRALVDDNTAPDQRTTLGLGSAAVEDVGTSTGDVVQLVDVGGSPGLPAVDGSNLTGISGGGGGTSYLDSGYIATATSGFAGDVVMGDTSASGGTWTIISGSNMSTSTGTWTAPAAGDYTFSSGCKTSTSPSDGANAIIEVDGVRYGAEGSWQSTRTVSARLSASDTAKFRCYHSNTYAEGGTGGAGGYITHFSVTSTGGTPGWAVAATGTEYETGDSWLGKTVYQALIAAGTCPNATTTSTSTGLGTSYVDDVLEVRLLADDGSTFLSGTYHGGSTVLTARYDDAAGEVDVIAAGNWSAYTCRVLLRYTK